MAIKVEVSEPGFGDCHGVTYRKGVRGEPTTLDQVLGTGANERPSIYQISDEQSGLTILAPISCPHLDISCLFCRKHRGAKGDYKWTDGPCPRVRVVGRTEKRQVISALQIAASTRSV